MLQYEELQKENQKLKATILELIATIEAKNHYIRTLEQENLDYQWRILDHVDL